MLCRTPERRTVSPTITGAASSWRAQAAEVLVAGGISYWSWTGNHPPLDVLERDVSEQAAVMKDAGADLLMLEMMADIDRMLCTLCGAQDNGLPVWVGLSCAPAEDGNMRLLSGEPIEAALIVLAERNVPLVSIMHTDVQHIDACLDLLDTHWNGLVGVYAHSGDYAEGKWIFESTILAASSVLLRKPGSEVAR